VRQVGDQNQGYTMMHGQVIIKRIPGFVVRF